MTRALVADIGRTTTRAALTTGTELGSIVVTDNGASLADLDGAAVVAASLAAATAELPDHDDQIDQIVLGVTGAAQRPDAARALGRRLAAAYARVEVTVTSDVVTAHAGALDGGPGVVTIAGTGAVALAVGVDGGRHLVDGWGYLLGDAGSGAQIGRCGLAAALRHHDGRGGSAALAAAAVVRFGPLDRLVATIQGDAHPVRTAASFAPDVAAAARAGDETALAILADAVAQLAETTLAAVHAIGDGAPVDVALVGGLFDLDDLVRRPVAQAVTNQDSTVRVLPARGDALRGAAAIADGRAEVHDPSLLRVPPRDHDGSTAATTPHLEEA